MYLGSVSCAHRQHQLCGAQPGELTETFWMQLCALSGPSRSPSTSERSVKSPLTAWSAALRHTANIPFQDSLPRPPLLSPGQASQTDPALNATPSAEAGPEGRDLTHIVLNGDKCRVLLHLRNHSRPPGLAPGPGLGARLSLVSPAARRSVLNLRTLALWRRGGARWFQRWLNLDLRIPKAGLTE